MDRLAWTRRGVRCVIFDMDGVLLDSEEGAFSMLLETLRMIGIEETMDVMLRDYLGKPGTVIRRELLAKHHSPVTEEELRALHHSRGSYYAMSDDVRPMDGLVDFLEALRGRDIPMGVVSSTTSRDVLTALNRMRILKYFSAVVCSDALARGKPAPDGYLKAAEYLQAPPEDCLIIEDSPMGIRSARNAGIRVIGYKGSKIAQDTSGADWETASYAQLWQALTEHGII